MNLYDVRTLLDRMLQHVVNHRSYHRGQVTTCYGGWAHGPRRVQTWCVLPASAEGQRRLEGLV